MFRFNLNRINILKVVCRVLAFGIISSATLAVNAQQDFNGRELLAITRVAQGGQEYSGLQFLTAKSTGFVNVAPIVGAGLGTGGAASSVEVKFNMTDYQDKDSRRRLDVTLAGPMAAQTFLVYTGNSGGGMYMGNEFRVSEAAASRHWGLMGFGTLNRAVDGQLKTDRLKDTDNNYVVEVKFNSSDNLRYYIDKRTFLTNKVVTYYNGKILVEEERSDYRKANCMMLPFHIVTKLGGQRVSDLNIESYDLKTVVPEARFTISVSE
ncbi:hypothetical protein BH20ACI4_BH20ACI4_03030 [soil metagenome]